MPLAKRQRRLFEKRGMHSKLKELSDAGKTISPDPSDIIIILDDSDDGSAPAAPPQGPSPSASPFSEPSRQQQRTSSLPRPTAQDLQPLIEQELGREIEEVEEIDICTTSEDEKLEQSEELKRKREPPQPSRLKFAPRAAIKTAPPPPPPPSIRHPASQPPARRPESRRPSPPSNSVQRQHQPLTLDTPYEFSTYEKASEFNRKFTRPPRASPGLSKSAVEKRAKQILDDLTQPTRQAMQKTQTAWKEAAMRWREKNKPTADDLKKRQEAEQARLSEAARSRAKNNPAAWAATANAKASDQSTSGQGPNGKHGGGASYHEPAAPRPRAGAPECEWRTYYRNVAQRKVSSAASFVQVLRIFGVTCDDPSKIKDAYRLAVRMYHPDSNSKERAWKNSTEKIQAEEVMKIINEKKEREL